MTTHSPEVLAMADRIREEHWPNFDAGVLAAPTQASELAELLDIAVEDHDTHFGRSNMPHHWTNVARAALRAFEHLRAAPNPKDTSDE